MNECHPLTLTPLALPKNAKMLPCAHVGDIKASSISLRSLSSPGHGPISKPFAIVRSGISLR
jgi:hypothetical protein